MNPLRLYLDETLVARQVTTGRVSFGTGNIKRSAKGGSMLYFSNSLTRAIDRQSRSRRQAFHALRIHYGVLLCLVFVSGCGNEPPPHVRQEVKPAGESTTEILQPENVDGVDAASVVESNRAGHVEHDSKTERGTSEVVRNEPEVEFGDEVYADYEPPVDRVALRPLTESYIEWTTPENVDYSQVHVTVVGPDGQRITQSFGAGESLALSSALPDGIYSWESVVSPQVDELTREEMNAVRSSGNLEAERELLERLRENGSLPSEEQGDRNRQSGTFSVVDGIARPNYVDTPKELSDRED